MGIGLLDDFIRKHRGERTLLEKLRDAVRALIGKLTGAEKRKAQTAEGKLTAALEAAAKAAEGSKNAATEGGEVKHSAKASRGRSVELETMENNRFQRLRQFGENLPEVWYAYSGKYLYVYENFNKMDYRVISKISVENRVLSNAVIEEVKNNADRTATAFDKRFEALQTQCGRHRSGDYSFGDRGTAVGDGGVFERGGVRSSGQDGSVQESGGTGEVKFSLKTDSQGRELSAGQREFFKDSKAVDEEGRLLVLYHGTDDRFTVFDTAESQPMEGSFFFAQNREDAAAYSSIGRVLPFYVNLRNPIDYNAMPSEIYKLKTKKEQVAALKRMGYDGWIADLETGWGEVSAFYPNQIKRTDNRNPTENADIRYSLKGKYWRPDLKAAEWELLKNRMAQEIGDDAHTLDKATKWVYAAENGTKVFALYGVGDGTEATVLYAAGGNRVEAELKKFNRYLEGRKNGTFQGAKMFDRWADGLRSERGTGGGRLYDATDGRADVADVRVSGGTQERNRRGTDRESTENRGDRNSLKGTTVTKEYEALVKENRLLREQMGDYTALKKKTLDLTKDRDYWKSQTRLTKGVATDYKAVEKAAARKNSRRFP